MVTASKSSDEITKANPPNAQEGETQAQDHAEQGNAKQEALKLDRGLSIGPNGQTYIYGITPQAFEAQSPKQQVKIRDSWSRAQEKLKVFGVPLEAFREMTPEAQVKIAKLDRKPTKNKLVKRLAIAGVFLTAAALTADEWVPALNSAVRGSPTSSRYGLDPETVRPQTQMPQPSEHDDTFFLPQAQERSIGL